MLSLQGICFGKGQMRQNDSAYDKRWFWGGLIGLIGMGIAMRLTGGVAFLLIYPLILSAFGKNKTELLLYCLLLDIAMVMSNSSVIPKSGLFSIVARSVYFIVAGVMVLQTVGQRQSKLLTPFLTLFFFLGYMALISAKGWSPLISYLKLTLFVTVYLGFYSVANASAIRQRVDAKKFRAIYLAFAAFFILGSIALIPFPQYGTMSSAEMAAIMEATGAGAAASFDSLFKGMALHSQSLGPVVSAIGALLLADLLFSVRKWDKLFLLLLVCTPVLIYMTGSRTAMGTYVASLCFTTFIFMCARGVGTKWKSKALSALFLVGAISGVALFGVPAVRDAALKFIVKYGDDTTEISSEQLWATRQGPMEAQMANFSESPIIGNGFQVSKAYEGFEARSINQLLSAPVEKGVWLTAILEEGGVFGMILFVLFIIVSSCLLWSRQAYIAWIMLVVMWVSNLGEFSMFSMTSCGGLIWALTFVGAIMDAQRIRQQDVARMQGYMPISPYAPRMPYGTMGPIPMR